MLSNEDAAALAHRGVDALRAGRAAEARQHLERIAASGRANAQIWLILATACNADGDNAAEDAALDQLLSVEPGLLRAHLMKAACRAQAGDEHGALSYYESALLLAASQDVSDDLAPELRHAEARVADARAKAEMKRAASLSAQGLALEDCSARFRESLEIMAGRKQIFVQSPTAYYFPGLPQVQFFDRAQFPWIETVEAATSDMRDELTGLLQDRMDGFRPYLKADRAQPRVDHNLLVDNLDWSALFLCENGRVSPEFVERCPKTWAAMQAAPLPRMSNAPTVMFSLLKAGARIAPHTGMFNTRLICHLPLIVPPGCGFRVGNEVRAWEEGRMLIFDDTIEHEAWNDGNADRVVLIFDIWRPELTEQERGEVAALLGQPG